jgi:Fur family ferric uptake transcriptional regulator
VLAALARLEPVLEARGMRLGVARRAIVEAVLERPGHFEIEHLVEALRRRGIRGSRASVYRTLPLLVEAGILQEAVIAGDVRTYEPALGREHHDHIVCVRCGKVVEFHYEAFDVLEREVAARHGFRLEGHLHQLVGRCSECQAAPGAVNR